MSQLEPRPRLGSRMDIDDVVNSLRAIQTYDYLRLSRNKDLSKYLASNDKKAGVENPKDKEMVQFSDSVIKINKRNRYQGRTLVLTNKSVYNFLTNKFSKPQRRIDFEKLEGVVLSRSSDEIVFQVDQEHDYRYVVQRRAEVVEVLSRFYEAICDKPIPIFFSEKRELKDFVITKNELEPGKTKVREKSASAVSETAASPQIKPSSKHKQQRSMSTLTIFDPTQSSKTENILNGFRKPDTVIEGWLTKMKGQREDKWDRKYFVLTSSRLSYFSPRIKGNILITESTVEPYVKTTAEEETKDEFVKDVVRFAMVIKSKNRRKPLVVAAESEDDMKQWQSAFQSVVEEGDREFVHLEGWLMKKDPTRKTWRRRYFVILKDRCWYFEMSLKGTIDLASGVSAHTSKQIAPTEGTHTNFAGMTSRTRFAYRFTVSDGHRLYKIGADTKEDMDTWIHQIDTAGRKHTPGITRKAANSAVPVELAKSLQENAPEGKVTFVFTDIQSSTSLWESEPDAMDQSLELHDRILRMLLKKFNGYEVKTEGDAFMVTFFRIVDAILWCLEVQLELNKQEWNEDLGKVAGAKTVMDSEGNTVFAGIRVRMGIHTGEPNCRRNPVTGRMDYFGPVVNESARVSDTGHGGQIVVTSPVKQMMDEGLEELEPYNVQSKDLGAHDLKGIAEPVQIFEVLPASLAMRSEVFPPIRTITNERKKKKEDADKTDKDPEEEEELSVRSTEYDYDDDDDALLEDESALNAIAEIEEETASLVVSNGFLEN